MVASHTEFAAPMVMGMRPWSLVVVLRLLVAELGSEVSVAIQTMMRKRADAIRKKYG